MNGQELRDHVLRLVSTVGFAETLIGPEMLQTFHRLALQSNPDLRHLEPPFDRPVQHRDTGQDIRPTEMQRILRSDVVPFVLAAIQSVGEDCLRAQYSGRDIKHLIEQAFDAGDVDRDLASRAHYWRVTRNVLIHNGGQINHQLVEEVQRLRESGWILFDRFVFWGPMVDTAEGRQCSLTVEAIQDPSNPDPGQTTEIEVGNEVRLGLGDLLAASEAWADIVEAVGN
jgi:hypothetical protein